MSFIQVQDALDVIQERYLEFASQLERLPKQDEHATEFARLVLKAERRMNDAVVYLRRTASRPILNGWLQFFPDNERSEVREVLRLRNGSHAPVNAEQLLDYYRDFNKHLMNLFELISRSTECEATRDLFLRMSVVERQNACDVAWAARDPV